MSLNRTLANLINTDGDVKTANLDLAASGGSLTMYDSIGLLPLSGVDSGSMAFVNSSNRMYVNNGQGWYSATIVNNTPTWDSGGEPNISYSITDSATPLVLNLSASDSEGIPITWTGVASDSSSSFVTISNTGDGTYTFTPIGSDSSGTFTYTFKASDGINILSKLSTISYSALEYITATGGDEIVKYGDYVYHVFTTTGSTSFVPASDVEVEYLIVGGGGGGGDPTDGDGGGGGGAGGLVVNTSGRSLTAGTYSVAVGAGGGTTASGSNSVFASATANGGGRGGRNYSLQNGVTGGSGGGGGVASESWSPGASNQPASDGYGGVGYGNAGGAKVSNNYGSGGGGAGEVGGTDDAINMEGGDGLYVDEFKYWGTDDTNNTSSQIRGYYAGGGGSGNTKYQSPGNKVGGIGGGGQGNTTAGQANTGGGGGGSRAGGSGIVIVRYRSSWDGN